MPENVKPVSPETLKEAARLLHAGKLVAFPTETVYGLGADATNDQAIASIYAAKGRPTFNPLIIHLADAESVWPYVLANNVARKLAALFWPGPMTMVLPRASSCPVSLLACAGLDTLAVRVPSHPVATALLRQVALPIAAPSANASGKLSPTEPIHVYESLGDKVDLILDAGHTMVGVESTVIDLSGSRPTILRHGGITREMLVEVIGDVAESAPITDPDQNAPKAPGMLSSHYAPGLPVRLNAVHAEPDEAFLGFGTMPDGGAVRLNLSPNSDTREAAANLFSMMRELDLPGLKSIAVMPIPEVGLGAAINDRLQRAAAPRC